MHRNVPQAGRRSSSQGRGQETRAYSIDHDFEGAAELTATLVHALSDVTGADVSRTELALADHVDPDALDRLYRPKPDGGARANSRLSFTLWGYDVTVYSDGHIAILPPRPQGQGRVGGRSVGSVGQPRDHYGP